MTQNLTDYQIKYNGQIMGRNTVYGIRAVRGLFDVDINSGSVPIPRGDGSIPGEDFVQAKNIEIELVVEGEKQSQTLASRIKQIRKAFQRQENPLSLWFKTPGDSEQFILARPSGVFVQEDTQSEHGLKPITVRLHAADPRLYSTDSKTVALGIHTIDSGGTEFPMDFDVEFTGEGGGANIFTNEGNAKAYPVISFGGPEDGGTIDAVKIINETTGQEIEITATILDGQTLKADMLSYIRADGDQVIGLDGASRYSDWALPREAFYLQPGDNILRYEITQGTSQDSTASLTWYDTSI